jgi:RHS repeat-associated protein
VDAGWDRIDAASGYLLNQENTVLWDKVQLDITVAKAGYVYVYLSNESEGTAVYFDDMAVTHTARIPQVTTANDYYPFGLRMEGVVNNTSLSNATGQYTYNGGSAWQNGAGNFANYLSTPLREYDPVLGRFNGIDIMAAKYAGLSPYVFALNNPVYWSDPSGADVTWREIESILAFLWNSPHGGSWSRTEYDERIGITHGGEGDRGDCLGCSLFTAPPVYVANGSGGYTVYVTTGQAYYSNYENMQGSTFINTISLPAYKFDHGQRNRDAFADGFLNPDSKTDFNQASNYSDFFGTVFIDGVRLGTAIEKLGTTGANALAKLSTTLAGAKTLGKYVGFIGAGLQAIEGFTEDGNFTSGDLAKVLIGVGMAVSPFGWAYAAIDLGVGLATGTTITDRIGSAVDNVVYEIKRN